MANSVNKMLVGLGGNALGDAVEFLNVAYEPLKTFINTGDYTDLMKVAKEYGAAALFSAALVMISVGGATAIAGPITGTLVAAGWAAFGLYDAIKNGRELFQKIQVDLGELVSDLDFLDAIGGDAAKTAELLELFYSAAKAGPGFTLENGDRFTYGYVEVADGVTVSGSDKNDALWLSDGGELKGGSGDDHLHVFGFGSVEGEAGNDALSTHKPELRDDDHGGVSRVVLDGGEGDDLLVSFGGVGAMLIGGEGRDALFSTAFKSQLYGDTIDGTDAEFYDPSNASEHSDVFWFWPQTFIMDARPNDILQMFGIPLTGGTNVLTYGPFGLPVLAGTSSLAADFNHPTLVYYGRTKANQLLVYNRLAELLSDEGQELNGTMVVENYDFGDLASGKTADLGMSWYILTGIYPYGVEAPDGAIGLIEGVFTLIARQIDAFVSLGKGLRWAPFDDPLVLDLDGDGIETISQSQSGVRFDFDGDFFSESVGWLSSDDGFLVLDADGNGRIDDVSEMFGAPGVSGFSELATLDENDDGFITIDDEGFAALQVWRDLDGDAFTDEGELFGLDELNIVSLSLDSTEVGGETPQGNTILSRGTYTLADGTVRGSADMAFDSDPLNTLFRGERGSAEWLSDVVDAKGYGSIVDLRVAASNDFGLSEIVEVAAATMVTPDLKAIREAATPIYGAWAQTQERTRELSPVLAEIDATGQTILLDRGVYSEDAVGGYWTLASGAPVLSTQGTEIARATLEDVLSSSTADGQVWRLEQGFSPISRDIELTQRDPMPYLVRIEDERAVIEDYAIQNTDGSWRLASGNDVFDSKGALLASPTLEDVLASPASEGFEWRVEEFGINPFANLPVEEMAVLLIDGQAVDYSVEVTDEDGTFAVWARNLDRALELQQITGEAGNFQLRNYEIDLDNLDEVGSTDDSAYRIELLTAGQLHFASSTFGIDFQPQIMSADTDPVSQLISYSVGSFNGEHAPTVGDDGSYLSTIDIAIQLFDEMFQTYIDVSRAFSVRIALQGGLQDFARGLTYEASTDRYLATTDRELAPMFEAIFEGAPEGEEATYDYLAAWKEILQNIYPDYHIKESGNLFTGIMEVDENFIAQMVIAAWENTDIDQDLLGVFNALGVDEEKLIQHSADATDIVGTTGQDYFYLSAGDQIYRGDFGSDVYFVGGNFGQDIIEDREAPGQKLKAGPDVLRFTQAKSSDIFAWRDGLDLVLEVVGTDDVLRVRDQFDGEFLEPFTGADISYDTEMTQIVFADGVIWDEFEIMTAVNHPLDTDDLVLGSQARDLLEGGKGNDILRGGRDGDIYIFREGDGQDRIIDDNDVATDDPIQKFDMVQIRGNFDAEDIKFVRAGDSDDVEMIVLDEEGVETGDRIFIEDQFGWINIPLLGLLFPNTIERIAFENGTYLVETDIMARVLEQAKTDGDDLIYGFHNSDTLDGGAGDDALFGAEQDDTYIYGRSYGSDVIEDIDNDFLTASHDVVVFQDDLRWSDFTFERLADSPTVTLRVTETGEALTLRDSYQWKTILGFNSLIEELNFSDGTSWDYNKLASHYVALATSEDDDVTFGFDIADTFLSSAGDDRLIGAYGSDKYEFQRGSGHDVIFDTGSDRGGDLLQFNELSFSDLELSREGEDLIFTIRNTGETIRLEAHYARGSLGDFRDQAQSRAIETFVFSDVTVDWRDLNPEDVDLVGSSAGNVLTGTNFAETIDGRQGDDTLVGGSDGDTYLFDVGYGSDIIIDRQIAVSWAQRDTLDRAIETDDAVRFGADISLDTAVFTKDGDDLLISILERTDTLRIRNQFRDIEDQIEWFEFFNGDRLHVSDVEERLAIVGGSRGDDLIEGAPSSPNVLDGRQGDDTLVGGHLSDTYAFGAAYDLDSIIESAAPVSGEIDRIVFSASVTPEGVKLLRDDNDLIIDLGNGTDRLTISEGLTTRQVEEFLFADGTLWNLEEIRNQMLIGTAGDDVVVGFDDRNDELIGGAGSDALQGGEGDDTYRFELGFGKDSIQDTSGIDEVVFGQGYSAAMLNVSDEDGDLLIRFEGHEGDSIIILGGAEAAGSVSLIEKFSFHDGTIVAIDDILLKLVEDQASDGGDVILAQNGLINSIDPGEGDDLILGSDGGTYIFQSGTGYDIVDTRGQSGESTIVFANLATENFELRRADIDGDDIIVAFKDTGDQILIRGALSDSNVSRLNFADGISLSKDQFISMAIASQATERADAIIGSTFDDDLQGGHGNDDIEGGEGDDVYWFERGDGRDVVSDSAGNDRVEIRGYTPEEAIVSRPVEGRAELLISFTGTNDEILIKEGIELVAFGDGTEWNNLDLESMAVGLGTEFDDVITGGDADDRIEGGGGNDLLKGAEGSDIYVFARGDGRDVIADGGSSGINRLEISDYVADDVAPVRHEDRPEDITLRFADGDEIVINGALGDDGGRIQEIVFEDGTVWGVRDLLIALEEMREPGADEHLVGTDDADVLIGQEGDDFLEGLGGGDEYVFALGDGSDTIKDGGLYGTDAIRFNGFDRADAVFQKGYPADTLVVTFLTSGDRIEVIGSLGNGAGDQIEEFRFDDQTILLSDVKATISDLDGTEAGETIVGSNDADVFGGGGGDDFLSGGIGSDTYLFARGDGQDVIEENGNNNQIDVLKISGYTSSELSFAQSTFSAGSLIISFENSDDSILIKNTLEGNGSDRVERIEFEDGSEAILIDDVRSNFLLGSIGDDRIVALGTVNDMIVGGGGDDILQGGAGNDTYVFARGDGRDFIVEQSFSGYDGLRLSGYAASELNFSRAKSDPSSLVLEFEGTDDRVKISNFFATSYRISVEYIEFENGEARIELADIKDQFFLGGDGNDIITSTIVETQQGAGGLGDDYLSLGLGADKYVFRSGDGRDVIEELGSSSGTDVLQIEGYDQSDVTFSVMPESVNSVMLSFAGSSDQIIIRNGLLGTNGVNKVERIDFVDDGTSLDFDQYAALALAGAHIDIAGTNGDDTLIGTAANERLVGRELDNTSTFTRAGDDTYIFKRGGGQDIIVDGALNGTDRVQIFGYAAQEVTFSRSPLADDDLLLQFEGTSDLITIRGMLSSNSNFFRSSNIEWFEFFEGDVDEPILISSIRPWTHNALIQIRVAASLTAARKFSGFLS